MYNEAQKKRYIEETNVTSNDVNVLSRVEKWEKEYSKDCSQWNSVEILDAYCGMSNGHSSTLIVINSILRKYTTWCISQNLVDDFMNHYDEITKDVIMSKFNNRVLKEREIYTREEIMEIVDQMVNPSDKLVFLGIFEGIGGKQYSDFINLSEDDLIGDNELQLPGRKITISPELVEIIKNSSRATAYTIYRVGGNRGDSYTLEPNNKCLRRCDSGSVAERDERSAMYRFIYNRYELIAKGIGIEYTSPKKIKISGEVDYIRNKVKDMPDFVANYSNIKVIVNTDEFISKYGKVDPQSIADKYGELI